MVLNRMHRYISIVILFSLLIGSLQLAWGELVTTIRDNGDPANRVDFVILGDGYTASELTKYADDVENAVNGFFEEEPFREYQSYFNVHRVDVISNESGADHPERDPCVYKDTAFDATYYCGGIVRLICVNNSKVNTVLSNSVNPNQRDMVLVIVNDSQYGGSGGAIAVASTNAAVIELVLHEVGHSFGLLADEYDYGTCRTTVEPPEPNVTMETRRDWIKWNVGGGPPTGWIDLSTPIPTITTDPGVPGLYEGAKYCPTRVYRPTYNSKMRSLNVPFEQINEEQLIKRTYNWVSPLDSCIPTDTDLALLRGQSQVFQVEVPEPLTHSLEIEWYVDGQYEGTGLEFPLDSTGLSLDFHTVDVEAWDPTSRVRNDPANVLTEQRSWTIQVTPPVVHADITIHPNTLNLKRRGKWITCYIELPEGYDVEDIDVGTVTLEETITAESKPAKIGDSDQDGIADLMVKFDSQQLIRYLDGATGTVTLMVTGEVEGTSFEGSDTIRLTERGKK